MKNYLLPAGLALALAACGGGGNDHDTAAAASAPVAVDAFTVLVQSQYMDASDTADVQLIDNVAVSSTDTIDPIAI